MNLSYALDNLILIIQLLYEFIDSNIVLRLMFVLCLFTIVCNIFSFITKIIGY